MGQKTSKQPEYWEKDGEHTQCQLCDTKFSVVRRRHHCRSCGGVFCAACTSRTASVPMRGFDNPVRVCDRCKLREGGVPNLPNALTGTSRSSTGATGNNGPQRSRSMDVHGYGIGAATEGNYRSATPRAASSLAIIENSSRNRGGTTPRYSGLGVPANSTSNAGRPPLGSNNNSNFPPPQRGQFLNERRSNNSNTAGASPSANNNNSNGGAHSVPNNNSKIAPIPARYRHAVLLLMFSPTSPFAKFENFLLVQTNSENNNKKQQQQQSTASSSSSVIGSLLLEFLKQPSQWFDRACIQTHKMSLLGDPYQDWSALTVVSRQPSGFSAGVVAKSTTSGINSSPQVAPALFLAAPTLPSTRSATLYLSLELVSSSSSSNNTNGNGNNDRNHQQFMDLSLIRSLQIGIAHESSMSSRTRALPTPAVSFTVDSLSTQRVPAIGVSLEGKSFCGAKVDDSEFFKLHPEQDIRSIVVAISFDQTSGSVAFSLMNATPLLMMANRNLAAGGQSSSSSNKNFIMARKSSPNMMNSNNTKNNLLAAAAGEGNSHNLPVLAAFPCSLPSGVAGKWFAAFSLDTAQLVDGTRLLAEWL